MSTKLEREIKALRKECEDAESDVLADFPESGDSGVYEAQQNVIYGSDKSDGAKAEVARMLGIQQPEWASPRARREREQAAEAAAKARRLEDFRNSCFAADRRAAMAAREDRR